MNVFLVIGISAAIVYAAILYGVHRLYTAEYQRRAAIGAAFRNRVRKHVIREGFWS
ncbi:hypothetical protein NKJ55_28630 [Mesorhizobium sp. M0106]|uniref:hypothetical protein n=1 Tax=Mesorhizobium sp. M0106 TaxID=2956880 RepID=UPI00333BA818